MRIFTMKLSCSLEVINTLSTVAGAAPLYVSFEGLNSFGALAVYLAFMNDLYTGLYVCTMTSQLVTCISIHDISLVNWRELVHQHVIRVQNLTYLTDSVRVEKFLQ